MSNLLESLNPSLCLPEIRISVTPAGNPVQFATTAGIFYWPDLYQGTASTPNGNLPGFITPYIGNVASGTYTGATFRSYAVNTPLTFSASIYSLASGVAVTAMTWNFGDGVTSTQTTPTHIYQYAVPSMIASVAIEYSDGRISYTPKQMNLIYPVTSSGMESYDFIGMGGTDYSMGGSMLGGIS